MCWQAQLFGTPVITTQFTAMADYTRLGISVPPVQMTWMVEGLAAQPSVDGMVKALARVYAGDPDVIGDVEETMRCCSSTTSTTFSSFIKEHAAVNHFD